MCFISSDKKNISHRGKFWSICDFFHILYNNIRLIFGVDFPGEKLPAIVEQTLFHTRDKQVLNFGAIFVDAPKETSGFWFWTHKWYTPVAFFHLGFSVFDILLVMTQYCRLKSFQT